MKIDKIVEYLTNGPDLDDFLVEQDVFGPLKTAKVVRELENYTSSDNAEVVKSVLYRLSKKWHESEFYYIIVKSVEFLGGEDYQTTGYTKLYGSNEDGDYLQYLGEVFLKDPDDVITKNGYKLQESYRESLEDLNKKIRKVVIHYLTEVERATYNVPGTTPVEYDNVWDEADPETEGGKTIEERLEEEINDKNYDLYVQESDRNNYEVSTPWLTIPVPFEEDDYFDKFDPYQTNIEIMKGKFLENLNGSLEKEWEIIAKYLELEVNAIQQKVQGIQFSLNWPISAFLAFNHKKLLAKVNKFLQFFGEQEIKSAFKQTLFDLYSK